MTSGTHEHHETPVQATMMRPGCVVIPVILLLAAVAFGTWTFWPRTQEQIDATASGSETAQWPAWMNQNVAYTPEQEPLVVARIEKDPHAEALARLIQQQDAMLRRQDALQKELDALKDKPPATTTQGKRPAPKHSEPISIRYEPPKTEQVLSEYEYVLAPGATKLPCIVETEMNSEVEGFFTAKITSPVYDTATGQHLLIPQNSTILAKYASDDLLYGNTRLPTWSLTLALPNGKDFELGQAPVTDNLGVMGLTGEVNQHFWRLLGAVLITGVLQGGQQVVSTEAVGAGTFAPLGTGIAQSANQAGQRRLGRALDTRPTIIVKAGQICNVILTKQLVLAEYR